MPDLKQKDLLNDERFRELSRDYPNQFVAKMGAEAIKDLLAQINVAELVEDLRGRMKEETSQQKKLKYSKRLKVANSFLRSGNNPQWMILDVIPVIPPELRPLVPLDGGRFATSDLNDLYRRVINRNNRRPAGDHDAAPRPGRGRDRPGRVRSVRDRPPRIHPRLPATSVPCTVGSGPMSGPIVGTRRHEARPVAFSEVTTTTDASAPARETSAMRGGCSPVICACGAPLTHAAQPARRITADRRVNIGRAVPRRRAHAATGRRLPQATVAAFARSGTAIVTVGGDAALVGRQNDRRTRQP